jgi:uncharacterized lipoprotein YajG
MSTLTTTALVAALLLGAGCASTRSERLTSVDAARKSEHKDFMASAVAATPRDVRVGHARHVGDVAAADDD